ncbi:MAG TPA: hypothetical protein PKD52_06540 [Clostridiales bacterium]|nr:hypothetical protein [Clostridiales bacterium]
MIELLSLYNSACQKVVAQPLSHQAGAVAALPSPGIKVPGRGDGAPLPALSLRTFGFIGSLYDTYSTIFFLFLNQNSIFYQFLRFVTKKRRIFQQYPE